MSPSTSATLAGAANGFSLVMFREFATTLYARSRNASTSPAPIPREAPVTIAVLIVFAICKLRLPSGAHELQKAGRDVGQKCVSVGHGRRHWCFPGRDTSVGAHARHHTNTRATARAPELCPSYRAETGDRSRRQEATLKSILRASANRIRAFRLIGRCLMRPRLQTASYR